MICGEVRKPGRRGFYAQLFQGFPHIEPEIFAVSLATAAVDRTTLGV